MRHGFSAYQQHACKRGCTSTMGLRPIVVNTGWNRDEVSETFGQAANTPKPQGPAGATTSLDDAFGMRTFRKLCIKLTMQTKPSQLTAESRRRYAMQCILNGMHPRGERGGAMQPCQETQKRAARQVIPQLLSHFRGDANDSAACCQDALFNGVYCILLETSFRRVAGSSHCTMCGSSSSFCNLLKNPSDKHC